MSDDSASTGGPLPLAAKWMVAPSGRINSAMVAPPSLGTPEVLQVQSRSTMLNSVADIPQLSKIFGVSTGTFEPHRSSETP